MSPGGGLWKDIKAVSPPGRKTWQKLDFVNLTNCGTKIDVWSLKKLRVQIMP